MSEDRNDPFPDILAPGEDPLDGLEAEDLRPLPAVKDGEPPRLLVVYPLRNSVPFPGLIMPVHADEGEEMDIMEQALAQGQRVGLLLAPDLAEDQRPRGKKDFARTGVLAEIHRRIKLPDGNSNYLCRGVRRFTVDRFVRTQGIPVARVSYPEDVYPPGDETEALARNVLSLAQQVANHNPSLGDGFKAILAKWDELDHSAISPFLMKTGMTITSNVGGCSCMAFTSRPWTRPVISIACPGPVAAAPCWPCSGESRALSAVRSWASIRMAPWWESAG